MSDRMMACRKCGAQVSEFAERCPGCRDKTAERMGHARSSSNAWKLAGLAAFVFVIWRIGSGYVGSESTAPVAPSSAPATAAAPGSTAQSTSRSGSPELCKANSETARMLMEARQSGALMSKAMATVGSGDEQHRKMIIAAWDSPRYSTPENQQRAVQDFENDVYLQCIKAGG